MRWYLLPLIPVFCIACLIIGEKIYVWYDNLKPGLTRTLVMWAGIAFGILLLLLEGPDLYY